MRPKEKVMMIFGSISAVIAGCLLPSISIAWGEVTNSFSPSRDKDSILN